MDDEVFAEAALEGITPSLHLTITGFAGPLIYQLANGGPNPSSPDFDDVTLGGNELFTALPGYDYVTDSMSCSWLFRVRG